MAFYEKGPVRIHYQKAGSGLPLFVIPGVRCITVRHVRTFLRAKRPA